MEQDQVPLILRQDSMVQSFSSSSLLDWVRIPIRTLSCFRRSSMLRDSSLESSPEQARWPSKQVGGGDCSPP
ncbi:hypothetical protein F2Q69_00057860 [Brassica cretica]|uniref:Uncharacterized protein n=1 Tax=Brassica cretica TaxID=69181 RepID=A0A8S9N2I3_BRACR|nr:hypothetical protein F2Q69_00057860 [Brassica cretica]